MTHSFSSPCPHHPPAFPHHLLSVDDLSLEAVWHLFALAQEKAELNQQRHKRRDLLQGRTQINLFLEPSTRTQTSFELAGKRLGVDVINIAVASSSLKKGESLIDTLTTLQAMAPDVMVIRHAQAGAVSLLAKFASCSLINAGDGAHEHPTQALLDAFTIFRHKGRIEGLIITICGDILHSRVARSNIRLLQRLGACVRVAGPPTLLPRDMENLGVEIFTHLPSAIKDADVVMTLRLQRERMNTGEIPSEKEYFKFYGISEKKLAHAKPDVLIMHPGPVNRGVELESRLLDHPSCLVLEQVEMGVAVRMALLQCLLLK